MSWFSLDMHDWVDLTNNKSSKKKEIIRRVDWQGNMQCQTTFFLKSSCSLFLCFFTDTIDRSPGGFPPSLLGLHFHFGMDRCQMQSLLLGKLAQLKLPVIFQSELLLPCTSCSPFPFSLLWHYSKPAIAILLAVSVFQLFGKSIEAAHRAMLRPLTCGGQALLPHSLEEA